MNDDQKNLLKGYNMLLYFAGAMLMSEPTEECLIDFWTKGILKRLPVTSTNPRFIKAAGILRDSCEENNSRLKLTEDFSRLFAEDGQQLAPALASEYLDRNTAYPEKVGEFYNAYGWKSKPQGQIPDDHLGVELLFLTKLIERYLVLDDDPCSREMKKEITRFINVHILSWIPGWYQAIEENAISLSYKGISLLIYSCMEDLAGLFSNGQRSQQS